jgi:hypothetical protein
MGVWGLTEMDLALVVWFLWDLSGNRQVVAAEPGVSASCYGFIYGFVYDFIYDFYLIFI